MFVTKLTRARFAYSPLSNVEMANFAESVRKVMWKRISTGINANDASAKPLKPGKNGKPGYPEWKIRWGGQPIRNWISPRRKPLGRQKIVNSLRVKTANENRAIIGFLDPNTDSVAHINNKVERMFGLSPKDRIEMMRILKSVLYTNNLVGSKKVLYGAAAAAVAKKEAA